MALSMISPIASKLGNLLVDEVTLLFGIDDKIKNLQKEFTWMQCFLEDIDARQDESKTLQNWVAQIREIAYDVDDVIDIYNIKIESQNEKGCMRFKRRCACIFNEACTLHKLGSSIDAITTQITTLTRQLETYGVKHSTKGDDSSLLQRKKEERGSYPHIVECNVVGLEKDIKDLVPTLIAEKKEFQTVAIWGMGGIGKTTLAKQIYHDNEVRRHFNCFGWAYVSQQCQPRDVWQELALCLVPEQRSEISMMKDAELPKKLHQLLTAKKCLIVVDDVWKIEDWNNLKVVFPYEKTNSIILVTSRNKEIASS